ncbi:MAG: hemolysin family protein [Nitriliruptoraceae bacterium]
MTGWWALGFAVALIVANGLFVAAEFSLLALRRSTVEELAAEGDRRSRVVVDELADVSFALSSAQFGITATSLLLGFLAERAIGDTLIRPLLALAGLPGPAAVPVSIGVALLLAASAQMVLGELVPKSLAIARPVPIARGVLPLTHVFGLLFGPLIRLLDRVAEAVTVHVLRVEVATELSGGRSLDELARIIRASGQIGSLSREQTKLLHRAVELGDRRTEEVMVPRPDVVSLPATATLADLRVAAQRTGYSRFPVHGAHEDDVIGSVHLKDLLAVPPAAYATTAVGALATPMLVVPESGRLRRLLADLRREQRTAALVIDEHGGTAGIVTLEDVLEELVGEIEDEFDAGSLVLRRVGPGRTVVDARLRVDRATDLFGEPLPDGAYETLAGFVLDQLGHLPEVGEVVRHGRLELTVSGLHGTRITELVVRELDGDGGIGC